MKLIEYLKPFDINGLTKKRLGNKYDGGYVVPFELLQNLTHCITYGVANDVSFEVDLQKMSPQCKFSFYDPTIQSLPANAPNKSIFYRKWISSECDDDKITPHQTIIDETDANSVICLKCDIEGSEYGSIQTLNADDTSRIAFLIIEIHWIYNSDLYEKCKSLLHFLSQHFTCFHTHANVYGGLYQFDNEFIPKVSIPRVFELTYINNNLVKAKTLYQNILPIPNLDFSNDPKVVDYDLSFLTLADNKIKI